MIHEIEGKFVISSHHSWVPGVYDTKKAANYAFRFPDKILNLIMKRKVEMMGPGNAYITFEDLKTLTYNSQS